MIDEMRTWLYPLGFLPSVAFGVRFFLQWIASEIRKESVVPRAFWHLSIIGNLIGFLHSCIQVQYHLCLIQAGNVVISWRHLDLLKNVKEQKNIRTVFSLLGISLIGTSLFFLVQSLVTHDFNWFHVPATPWKLVNQNTISFSWHLLGFLSLIFFSSRFFVQWWFNEKNKVCILGLPFWWISFMGNIACLIYFVRIGDPANFIGPLFNFLPTIRNLMLIYQAKRSAAA